MWEDQPEPPSAKGKIIAVSILLVGVSLALYLFVRTGGVARFQKVQSQTTPDPAREVGDQERALILGAVGRRVVLPNDEVPSITVIRSLETLPRAEVLRDAEVGDLLITYTKSAKVIVYRGEGERIIATGVLTPLLAGESSTPQASPVAPSSPLATPAVTATPLPALKIYWLNASGVVGKTGEVEKILLADTMVSIEVLGRSNAVGKQKGTTIVVREGIEPARYQKIGELLEAQVATLPSGEPARDGADLIIIVGS